MARSPRRTAGAILSLSTGSFAIGTAEFAVMGLLPYIASGLSVDIADAGHLVSAYALGVVVGAPLLSAFTTRLPKKNVVLGLMTFFALANLSSFVAPTYGILWITRFASGLPHGAYFGLAAVVAASLVTPGQRGRAIALVMIGLAVANVLGVPTVTFLGQAFGWRVLFLFVGAIGILTVLAVQWLVPRQPNASHTSARSEIRALHQPQVWLTLGIGVIGFDGFFAVYTYIAPMMHEATQIPLVWLPLILALYGLGMVLGNILGGKLADHSPLQGIYLVMSLLIGVLILFALGLPTPWLALPLVFLVGAVGTALVPCLQTRLLDVAPGASLTASMNHAAINIANGLGALLGGLVLSWHWGFAAPPLLGAALAFLGLLLARASGRLEHKTKQR